MKQKLFRLLLIGGLVAGSALWAAPAAAFHTITFDPCPTAEPPSEEPAVPDPNEELEEEEPEPDPCVVREVQNIRFTISPWQPAASPIERVVLTAVPNEEGLEASNVVLRVWERAELDQSDGELSFDWDTAKSISLNGRYRLRVNLEGHNQDSEHPDVFIVDNKPAPPGAPKISDRTTSSVTIEWERGPEKDLTGYILLRAVTEGGEPPPTSDLQAIEILKKEESFIDTDVEHGKTYWYALRSLRRSVIFPNGQWSNLGPMSGEGAQLVATPPPAQPAPVPDQRPRPGVTIPRPGPRGSVPIPTPQDPGFGDLAFDRDNAVRQPEIRNEAGDDRGPIIPVAVGAFLLSTALAFARMPY